LQTVLDFLAAEDLPAPGDVASNDAE